MSHTTAGDAWPLGVQDPIERASRALVLMEQARARMEELADIRARAIYEVYCLYGGSKTARLLGMSRMNLYRLIGQVPEVRQQRLDNRLQAAAMFAAALSAASTSESSDARSPSTGPNTRRLSEGGGRNGGR